MHAQSHFGRPLLALTCSLALASGCGNSDDDAANTGGTSATTGGAGTGGTHAGAGRGGGTSAGGTKNSGSGG
ncbi:MAG TPA: hypothetical protein VLJ38_17590, partial [Polyangiaceae bacterium]|nr:hypothetical protein [Polyangiaceae bacterium]